jgi:6-phosphofructokinase 2
LSFERSLFSTNLTLSVTNSAAPSPIVSLSLNPAIDLTYEFDCLVHEQKSRAYTTHYDPGGTGVNVGRALEKLNNHSHTCCIIAGMMGQFLDSMLKQELKNVTTLQAEGETRINTTLVQQSPARQYEVNATGSTINSEQLEQITLQFLALCGQGIGVLTGSLPPGTPDTTYQKINIRLKEQGARAMIDAPIVALKKAIESQPFLIKPNLHELELLQNKTLGTLEKIAVEARFIVQQGTQHVCVSLGEKGALLTTPDNSYFCNSPAITVRSTVGSGDAMVAGLAHAFNQQKSPSQALRLAVACGAGTAKKAGTQLFDVNELDGLMSMIEIKTLHI